jgi:hypothetical protein
MGFLNKLGNSKYLKKEDAQPTPLLLTITEICEENVAMENEPDKFKQVVYFAETDKGFVLGKTTGQQIASFLGDPGDNPTAWYGQKIVLFCDPSVTMRGDVVGGLRVRQPRGQAQAPAPAQQPPQRQAPAPRAPQGPPPEEDDVPY